MRRRDFLGVLGVLSCSGALSAEAPRNEHVRRIGVLMNQSPEDPRLKSRAAAFVEELGRLGWHDSETVRIDYRWAEGDGERVRALAAELVALAPDVILAIGGFGVGPLMQATGTIPIVFVSVADPVGSGFVTSLARPGGNVTGFANFEYGISAKWLELLKQMAPSVVRAAVLHDPALVSGAGLLDAVQSAAPSLGVELSPISAGDGGEIEQALAAFAARPSGGLVVTPNAAVILHRDLIIGLTEQHRLPAIYPYSVFAKAGGLMSYGPDTMEQYPRAAGYVDRIFRGESVSDLPVQAPTRYELAINVRTASTLGLEVPANLLVLADEVIE